MISLILKPMMWFCLSFLVLSVPIKREPIFNHLTNIFGESAQDLIDDFSTKASQSVKVGKRAIEQLFQTVPQNSDRLKVKQSSVKKEVPPEDEYTIEERELLKQILKE